MRAKRASLTRPRREKKNLSVSPLPRSLFSASFQTFSLTSRAYLNTQKYGLFCSLKANGKIFSRRLRRYSVYDNWIHCKQRFTVIDIRWSFVDYEQSLFFLGPSSKKARDTQMITHLLISIPFHLFSSLPKKWHPCITAWWRRVTYEYNKDLHDECCLLGAWSI